MSDKANAAADQTAVTPQPGTPEYDAAMAAKFDAANPQGVTPEAPVRPEHVPEKFWNAETGVIDTAAWAQSYKELEQKQSQGKTETPQTPAAGTEGAATDDAAKAALESKGLKLDDFSAEFQTTGALSDGSYQKLAEAGIPKPMVDAYIAGQQALAAQVQAQGFEVAGGKEQFEQMVKWASTGLTPGEIAAYDAAVTGGSVDQMKLAVAGLRARYEAANGREPGLLGGKPGSGNAPGYASRAEMTTDMKDPRYSKDPAFRAKVEAKLAATTAF